MPVCAGSCGVCETEVWILSLKHTECVLGCNYDGQKAVIIDDYGGTIEAVHLKTWFDRYPCQVEVKGGSMALRATTFIVTSNFDLETLIAKMCPDRDSDYLRQTWNALRIRIHKYVEYRAFNTYTSVRVIELPTDMML